MAQIISQTGFAHLTDLPCFRLQLGHATAVISAYGAQLLSYCPHPQQEVLWLSSEATWHNHTAIRGGVPVCWPWFGPAASQLNPDNVSLPNHGLVRNRLWQLEAHQITADSISLTLLITLNDLPYIDGSCELRLTVTLTEHQLTLRLHCNQPMLRQAALHSYFNIGNIRHTTVSRLPRRYHDKVQQTIVDNATTELTIQEETDRIYQQPGAELLIQTPGQHLQLKQHGHDATVVWNPWQQKSRQLSDVTDDGYLHFVCVESASLSLAQADTLDLSQTLSLERVDA